MLQNWCSALATHTGNVIHEYGTLEGSDELFLKADQKNKAHLFSALYFVFH